MKLRVVIKQYGAESIFEIEDLDDSHTLLDALEILRTREPKIATAKLGPRLAYRHSCHHGSCGTCGALVNGVPKLLCRTFMADVEGESVTLEALRGAEILEGIAVRPGPLFDSLPDTDYLRDQPERMEDCIECGLCVAGCPAPGPFAGPAALAAIDVEWKKHPERELEMRAAAAAPDGVAGCERAYICSKVCPQAVAPGRRINDLRKRL